MMAVLILMGGDMAIPVLTVAFILHAFSRPFLSLPLRLVKR
jgi:hypothetical protein